jgi:hypothetical protein
MKLSLEVFGIFFHLDETEHVQDMLKKSSGFQSLGTGVKILGHQKNKPHNLSVNKSQGEGKDEQDQFVRFKPEHLDRL